MAESKKLNLNKVEVVEDMITAELDQNDDIVEYIQPSNLELLKARYAAAEEDEAIRNEGFEPIKKGGLIKKPRPESTAFDYFSAPVAPRDEIRTDVDSPLSRVFDTTKSEFDADTASFSDINIYSAEPAVEVEEKDAVPTPVKKKTTRAKKTADEVMEEPPAPEKKRATRTKKTAEETATEFNEEKAVKKPATITKKSTSEEEKTEITGIGQEPIVQTPPPTVNNRYGFNTNTRVIYIDENADDGIQRNSDFELDSAFKAEEKEKRRLSFWSRRKK